MNKGDRVKVYGWTERTSHDYPLELQFAYRRGEPGTVSGIVIGDEIYVDLDKGGWVNVHAKQCEKIGE